MESFLRVVAFLLFLSAGFNQTLFDQPPADLVAFALACWVLATLVGEWGPMFTFARKE